MEISLARAHQVDEIFNIFRKCKLDLDRQHIFQWTDAYPSPEVIADDIRNQYMYSLNDESRSLGVVNISEVQDKEYATVDWRDKAGQVLTVHRLAIDPAHQGKGLARKLMDFAENYAVQKGYTSIRLDAYSDNKRSNIFYELRGYEKRGEVYFSGRTSIFYCYEKILK